MAEGCDGHDNAPELLDLDGEPLVADADVWDDVLMRNGVRGALPSVEGPYPRHWLGLLACPCTVGSALVVGAEFGIRVATSMRVPCGNVYIGLLPSNVAALEPVAPSLDRFRHVRRPPPGS